MGKNEANLQQQQQQRSSNNGAAQNSSRCICAGCRLVFNTLNKQLSFRCIVVLILSLSIFFSGIFWILHYHATKSRFDAQDAVKLNATVQAYFKLEKPVMDLVPHIGRLEYDINGEIGVPGTKDVFLRITNKMGSTKAPTVIVQADLVSDLGRIVPQRLKQLAETITGSPAENLGLNNTVFGKVKSISLSQKHPTPGNHPTSSPAPSPKPSISRYPTSRVHSPAPSPELHNLRPAPVPDVHRLRPAPSPEIHHLPPALSPDIHLLPPAPSPDYHHLSPAPSPGIHHLPQASSPGIHHLPPAPSPDAHPLPPAPSPDIRRRLPPAPSPDIDLLPPAPSKVPAHSRPCPYQGSRIPPSSSPNSRPNPTAPPSHAPTSFPHSPSMSPSSQVSPPVLPTPVVYYASSPDNKGSAPDLKSPSPAQSLPLSAGDCYKESQLLEFSALFIFYLLCCWR